MVPLLRSYHILMTQGDLIVLTRGSGFRAGGSVERYSFNIIEEKRQNIKSYSLGGQSTPLGQHICPCTSPVLLDRSSQFCKPMDNPQDIDQEDPHRLNHSMIHKSCTPIQQDTLAIRLFDRE